ncbi:unnamed protein product [Brassicogethes aeneus]|uniref:Nucleotide exchange factor Fes1 domain-containing protein n=1 Tax=Brassicogethes aeneus TaxID=1431903 RepID=A0A9P0AVY0_BRAAE|nr:unnamed protein product [Brassicogethes aeneus]
MPGVKKGETEAAQLQENLEGASIDDTIQPRQPTSLQGLLRFAMEATKDEDAPHSSELKPMDEERKKFLEEALKTMTINVVEVLQKQIAVLKNVGELKANDDPKDYLTAIENICEYIDNIDIANDFHKIGGLMILRPCLQSQNSKIRAGGCELIALLTQNNPTCQKIILENAFLPELIALLDTDNDVKVSIKSIYAISCLVRENNEGFNELIAHNGLHVFLKALKSKEERIIVKLAFLLSALCKSQPDLKSRLVFLEYFPVLISLVNEERNMGHEFLLSLLVTLTEDNPAAINEIKDPKYSFKDIITKYRSSILNREECEEEDQYCRILLHQIG